jgi:hypothetical protein
MTEAEWLAGGDPDPLLECVRGFKLLTARKARLFACGCFRLVWDRVTHEDVRTTVAVAEERADRRVSQQELDRHRYPMTHPSDDVANWLALAAQSLAVANLNPRYVAWSVRAAVENARYSAARSGVDYPPQADLIRCHFGNPFRPVTADPAWLTSTVTTLAEGVYADRAFDRLPILADALQDAGCDNADTLNHCRGNGVHVRGCWVVDLLTGRE